jgi:UDPglucose--hexose-1-phosphate uridylyltransferase
MTIRNNYLTGETVYIAENRANRPIEFDAAAVDRRIGRSSYVDACPFCPANEHLAATEIYRSQNDRVRIIMNKYPFVETLAGRHYVLIDTPDHQEKIYNFSAADITEIFIAARRNFTHEYNHGAAYIQLFKNDGANAGASLRHSHWQITSLTSPPPKHFTVSENFNKYFNEHDSCYICDIIKENSYTVYANRHFKAYCPYAPLYANEINIAPEAHIQSLTQMNDETLMSLGDVLLSCLSALNALIPYFSFNVYLHESRPDNKNSHFYLVIAPRVGSLAGFELATGIRVHSEPPENSVINIRKHLAI